MDNVTHTLIGLIAGEIVAAEASPISPHITVSARRALLVAVAVIGSNSPDLDLLVSLSARDTLGYVLWHRGYTHTVLGCLALALLLYACVEIYMRLRHLEPSRRDRLLLLSVAILTTALHLGMDYLNSYGVHPFWPIENRWSYGDSVFIVEPLYWVAAAPLLCSLRTRLARGLFTLALALVIGVGAASRLLLPASCVLLALFAIALAAWGARASPRAAARLAVALWLAITLSFLLTGRSASSRAAEAARTQFPEERVLDRVLTPLPTNPLCWDLILLETHGDQYVARHAMLALAPRLLSARACPAVGTDRHTAPLRRVTAPDSDAMRWFGEFEMSRSALAARVRASCEARAFMLFDRAPFIAEMQPSGRDAPETVLGDLRFDRGSDRGGFEVPLEPMQKLQRCPRAAPWSAPRADLAPDSRLDLDAAPIQQQ